MTPRALIAGLTCLAALPASSQTLPANSTNPIFPTSPAAKADAAGSVSTPLLALQNTSAPAEPTPTDHKHFFVGISGGLYFPTQRKVQDLFGSTIYKISLDLGAHQVIHNGLFVPTFSVVSADKDGNKFFLGQLMAGYEIRLAQPTILHDLKIEPYARFSLGAAYADYSITDNTATHYGAKRILPTGQALAGLLLGDRLRVTLAYDFFESVDSFNFNGIALSVAYTLFRF